MLNVKYEKFFNPRKRVYDMKADLHAHGPIRFHKYFLKKQGYKENILKLMTDVCFKRAIAICAIISEEADQRKEGYRKRDGIKLVAKGILKNKVNLSDVIEENSEVKKIEKNSVNNRFGFLLKEMKKMPRGYEAKMLGKNIIIVKKGNRKVFFINGQTVHSIDGKRVIESLVIGTNEIANYLKIEDFLKIVKKENYVIIAEHPACESHHGIGKKLLQEYKDYYDAVEGHNSQLMVPALFFPWSDFLSSFTKKKNAEAKVLAASLKKPWVATSDCHRIEDIGVSYIEFKDKINTSNEKDFLKDLKRIVSNNNFNKKCSYQPVLGGLSWSSKLLWGAGIKKI